MSFSIQTNVNSLVAQENLRVNGEFQSRTINRLTSGYRINSSGDDAAGLSVANKFRSDVAELQQGVRNANDGISQLQIIDGGLNNITKMLDRLKTLATQSASTTFTGDRATLNNEYKAVLGEIDRQASNIFLTSGGKFNRNIEVYIGGGSNQTNAKISVDLSGSANRVDAAGLGLSTSNVAASGTSLDTNTVRLDNTAGNFSATQNFTFNIAGQASPVVVQYDGSGVTSGINKMNSSLSQYGISASIGNDGMLQFSGGVAFSVAAENVANGLATGNAKADINKGLYAYNGAFTAVTDSTATENVTFTNDKGSVSISFTTANAGSIGTAIATLNEQLESLGIYAVKDSAGTGLTLQSSGSFTMLKTQQATTGDVLTDGLGAKALTNGTPTKEGTAANSAITAINSAVERLGLVQGRVGTGQNKLSYAIQLAQSQVSNFSAAESRIRDADVASEAANLTKAQVLQQASLAAMAQANSAPQAVMALLRG